MLCVMLSVLEERGPYKGSLDPLPPLHVTEWNGEVCLFVFPGAVIFFNRALMIDDFSGVLNRCIYFYLSDLLFIFHS